METPLCANYLDGLCERSDTCIFETKDGRSYVIFCRNCKLVHGWTRSKAKAEAQDQVRIKREREGRDRERERARRAIPFYAPRSGWISG